jgi:hypothetical protein
MGQNFVFLIVIVGILLSACGRKGPVQPLEESTFPHTYPKPLKQSSFPIKKPERKDCCDDA